MIQNYDLVIIGFINLGSLMDLLPSKILDQQTML
jgi:hypothetical protein